MEVAIWHFLFWNLKKKLDYNVELVNYAKIYSED